MPMLSSRVSLLLAAALAGCAIGVPFTRPPESFVRLGETTRAQVEARFGTPGREQSYRQDGLQARFHLPIGRGWPLDGSLSAVCGQNAYMLYADPGEIVADSFTLSLARGADGSLIAKWDYGPTWSVEHVWARFDRLP